MWLTSLVRYVPKERGNGPDVGCAICLHELGKKRVAAHKRVISCGDTPIHPVHYECLIANKNANCLACKAPIIPGSYWSTRKVLMIGAGVGAFLGALPYITDIAIATLSKIEPYTHIATDVAIATLSKIEPYISKFGILEKVGLY